MVILRHVLLVVYLAGFLFSANGWMAKFDDLERAAGFVPRRDEYTPLVFACALAWPITVWALVSPMEISHGR